MKAIKIFVSYAIEDKHIAERLHAALALHANLEPWLDRRDLQPGDYWKQTILNAIDRSDYMLLVLSSQSVTKTGFVQREIREALELATLRPPGVRFIIPVRVDECRPLHLQLRDLQWLDLFPDWSLGMLRLYELFGVRHYTHYYTIPVRNEHPRDDTVVLVPIEEGMPARAAAVKLVNMFSLPITMENLVPDIGLPAGGTTGGILVRLWTSASKRPKTYVKQEWNEMSDALYAPGGRSPQQKLSLVERFLRQWALAREEAPETEEDWRALRRCRLSEGRDPQFLKTIPPFRRWTPSVCVNAANVV